MGSNQFLITGERYVAHKTKESSKYVIKACADETSLENTLDINSLTYEFANTERQLWNCQLNCF